MEHFYNEIEGWFSFKTLYSDQVKRAKDGYHFVEVGAWLGCSTSYMGVEIINSNKKIKFDVVDIWCNFTQTTSVVVPDDLFETFLKNTARVASVINPIKRKSVEAAALYTDESLDFVFIDANHQYEYILDDIKAWLPKVKKGGYIGGHDYHPTWPGVMKAVNESFDGELESIVSMEDSWLYHKKEKTEAILWFACERPEYAKVSLESIFQTNERPKDFYAYVDRSKGGESLEIVKLLESYGVENIVHRDVNVKMAVNSLGATKDAFEKGYDIVHYFEEDVIVSKDYFVKSREILANPKISMFCGCVVIEDQINKVCSTLTPWGNSIKKRVYSLMKPHIEPYLVCYGKSLQEVVKYYSENLDFEGSGQADGLLQAVVGKNNLYVQFPERSYSKDIGVYGYHRKKGAIPVKTLEEWAMEPIEDVYGYGINGINFKL